MPSVQRQGDANSAGGVIRTGDSSVKINNRPVAVVGLPVSAHLPCPRGRSHCNAKTSVEVARSVRVNNKFISITGDKDTCDHPRRGGSPDVKVGS
jgi:uncharacterized Zn-binding protein involved in type VI secretion